MSKKKKEKMINEFNHCVFHTIDGSYTYRQLVSKYDSCDVVKNYAKIEKYVGSLKVNTIVVSALVSITIVFAPNVKITVDPCIEECISPEHETKGWVRSPKYNSRKMPKATKAEIKKYCNV